MKKLLLILSSLAVLALGAFIVFIPSVTAPSESFGASNTNQFIGGFPYFLAGSGISSTATSIILTSLTLPQTGYEILTSDVSSPFYLTLEPGNTGKQEFISCTTITQSASNATATLSGCVRGLKPISPYTSSGSYAFSHTGGSVVVFSNSPQFYQQFLALGNVSTSTNTLIFSSTTPPYYDSPGAQAAGTYIATTSELASVAYVNAVAFSAAPNGTTVVKGIYQSATGLQAASSTALGSTGASLVIPASVATDTPNTATRGSKVLMSLIGGFLNQAWLDLTANWTFTGAVSVAASASKNFTLNTVAYTFPSANGIASSTLTNNNAGTLSWGQPFSELLDSSTTPTQLSASTATTTLYTYNVPANTLSTGNVIRVSIYMSTMSIINADTFGLEVGYGNNASTTIYSANGTGGTANFRGSVITYLLQASGTNTTQVTNLNVNMVQDGFNTGSKTLGFSSSASLTTDSTQAQKITVAAAVGNASSNFKPLRVVTEILRN